MSGLLNSTGAVSGILGTITAPAVGTGTDGYVFTATGAGVDPAWEAVAAAGNSYAIICDQKAYDVSGGSFTSGAFRTRDLNTEISDIDGIVSISSNQFTLASAGTYIIEWYCPCYNVQYHLTKLQQTSGTPAVIKYGTSERTGTSGGDTSEQSVGKAIHVISGSTTYEIQHRCTTTRTHGFGAGQSSLDSGTVSIFTIVMITKLP